MEQEREFLGGEEQKEFAPAEVEHIQVWLPCSVALAVQTRPELNYHQIGKSKNFNFPSFVRSTHGRGKIENVIAALLVVDFLKNPSRQMKGYATNSWGGEREIRVNSLAFPDACAF